MVVDAHCHLTAKAFGKDRKHVIDEARALGVRAFVSAATDRASWAALLALAKEYPCVSIALGLHPWFDHGSSDLEALEQALVSRSDSVVALGECGVDARSESHEQWDLFDAQLNIASRLGLPVVIHCVRLNDQVAKQLRCYPNIPGGLIHGFAGSLVQARRFIDQGYVVGIGGAVTFDRAQKLKRVVTGLPADGFVLETDSPDMLPAPLRGIVERNTPSSIMLVAQEVARLRKQSMKQVAQETTANVRRVFEW